LNIALLYPGSHGTPWDEMLIRSLSNEAAVSRITVLCRAGKKVQRRRNPAQRLADAAQFRLAGIRRELLPLTKLSTIASVTVHPNAGASIPALLRSEPPDLLVDFTDSTESLKTLNPPKGVLELWINRRRGDLGYSIDSPRAAPTSEQQPIEVTLRFAAARKTLEASIPPAISPFPAANRRNEMSRSVALIIRAVRRVMAGNIEDAGRSEQIGYDGTRTENPTAVPAVAMRAVLRRLKRWRSGGEKWAVAFRTERENFVCNTAHPTPGGFKLIEVSGRRFLADPCTFTHRGSAYIFFEDLTEAHGLGVISYSTLEMDGSLSAPREALKRPYHLSYPFVFEHDGTVYMVPESSQNGTVDLYAATRFPDRWEHRACLLKETNATDATLYHDGKRWWMFASVGEFGAAAWDELFLFSAAELEGPWSPHPRNPVKQDAASSRPAGRLFRRGSQLIRPTQDCSRTYGGAINLCTVETLTTEGFVERVVENIPPAWVDGAQALHTLSATAELEAIDVRF
jgi:hypothetical protein